MENQEKALASPFGRGGDFEEIFGEGLLPQSATLTAPSEKEPYIALLRTALIFPSQSRYAR